MIHKRPAGHTGERLYLSLVAALLFSAACAWLGAGLFSAAEMRLNSALVTYGEHVETIELTGIALRYESPLEGEGLLPLASEGERLPAGAAAALKASGESILTEGSALYMANCDGYESLSPDILDSIDLHGLEKLLKSAPLTESQAGRLVYGQAWYYAALLPEGTELSPGKYNLDFGPAGTVQARLLRTECESGGTLGIFRAAEFSGELLSLRRAEARLILRDYRGYSVPEEALYQTEDGRSLLQVCSAAGTRTVEVETLCTDNGRALVRPGNEAALRAGERVLCPAREITEGN